MSLIHRVTDPEYLRGPEPREILECVTRGGARGMRRPDIGSLDGSLTSEEVYALTAFILYRNGIIKETYLLDAASLPKIKMPKRDPHLDKVAPH